MEAQHLQRVAFFLLCLALLFVVSAAKVPSGGGHLKLTGNVTDPCNQWPNCSVCISNKFCGWCSTPVKYQDGSPGFQCAGFAADNSTNPFICVGTYSTEKCLVGYNCSDTTKQCVQTDPGNGVPIDQCTATCYPKTYSCSPTNVSCVETPADKGGIPLSVCQAQCSASNTTPADVIGTWRGLEISGGFARGEWRLLINTANASLMDPQGALVYAGSVSQVQQYIVITITSGATAGMKVYALYQTEIGPVTKWVTIAASRPGGQPPEGFDDAMASPSAQEFVFVSCIDSTICDFGVAEAVMTKYSLKKKITEPDHCSVNQNCTSCLNSPFCGWCSTNVIYQGNIIGANCAGFNPNTTDNPFVCVGTYSTQKCPIPPAQYTCNNSTQQCVISQSGQSGSVCNATCGKNNSVILYKCNVAKMTCEPNNEGQDQGTCNSTCQLRPFPVDINGVWRGLQVNKNYTAGEYGLVVSSNDEYTSNFIFTSPTDITLYGQLSHVASEAVLIVNITAPVPAKRYSMYELQYGPETAYLTLANGPADSDTYPSFTDAMTSAGMSELNFIRCLNPTLCKF